MEDLFEDFIKGDDVKAIKAQLKILRTSEIVFAVVGYLIALLVLPKTIIAGTLLIFFSLVLTHLINKWKKTS